MQSAAIPEILKGGDLLLASHTGSGKTLAYLLPLVHFQSNSWKSVAIKKYIGLQEGRVTYLQVKLLKDQEREGGAAARAKRPRALVLGPTRELTDQILSVAKSISHHAKFRSACVNGGEYILAFSYLQSFEAALFPAQSE